MTLDANGIWIYDEFEDAAPVSTMLNRLGQSVSDVVGPIITNNTGWIDLDPDPLITSPSGYPMQAKRQGDIVMFRGRAQQVNTGSPWPSGSVILASVPDGYEDLFIPDNIREGGPVMYGVSSSVGRLYMSTAGNLTAGGVSGLGGTNILYVSPLVYML